MTADKISKLRPRDGHIFTVAELDAMGLTTGKRTRLVRSGAMTRALSGVYVPNQWAADVCAEGDDRVREQLMVRVAAALHHHPDAVVSHQSAAEIHGLQGGSNPARVVVTAPGSHHTKGPGCRIWTTQLPIEDIVSVDGIRVTSVLRTAIDVARTEVDGRALAVMDHTMRRLVVQQLGELPARELRRLLARGHLMEPIRESLLETAKALRGCIGIAKARQAIRLAHPASESVLESISRSNMLVANLPLPMIGMPVLGASGKEYWADALWPDQRVIGEADGAVKYQTIDDVLREKDRQDDLTRAGYQVVRWRWKEGVVKPMIMINRLRPTLL